MRRWDDVISLIVSTLLLILPPLPLARRVLVPQICHWHWTSWLGYGLFSVVRAVGAV